MISLRSLLGYHGSARSELAQGIVEGPSAIVTDRPFRQGRETELIRVSVLPPSGKFG